MRSRLKYEFDNKWIPFHQNGKFSARDSFFPASIRSSYRATEPSIHDVVTSLGIEYSLIRVRENGRLKWIDRNGFIFPHLPTDIDSTFNLLRWIAPSPAGYKYLFAKWNQWMHSNGKSVRMWIPAGGNKETKIPVQIQAVHASALHHNNVDEFYILVRNLTKEWELRNKQREQIRKLRQVNDAFRADYNNWLHDWKSALGTIESSTWLCQRYEAESEQEKRQRHLKRIEKAVKEIKVGMNDWQQWNQPPSVRTFQTVSLPDLIKERIEQINSSLKDGQIIHFWFQGEASFKTDPQALQHILDNLLSNASKFSPDHSPTWIRCWNRGDQVRIEIRDEGIGVPKEECSKLFESRYRATNAQNIPGNGVGLAIVERLIKQLGGTIELSSQPNRGTIFSITIKNQPKCYEKSIDHRGQSGNPVKHH